MSRNLNLLSFFLYGLIICASDIPYIIYTTESFQVPAENIAELHNETIPLISNFESLETEIIYKETTQQPVKEKSTTQQQKEKSLWDKFLDIFADEMTTFNVYNRMLKRGCHNKSYSV